MEQNQVHDEIVGKCNFDVHNHEYTVPPQNKRVLQTFVETSQFCEKLKKKRAEQTTARHVVQTYIRSENFGLTEALQLASRNTTTKSRQYPSHPALHLIFKRDNGVLRAVGKKIYDTFDDFVVTIGVQHGMSDIG